MNGSQEVIPPHQVFFEGQQKTGCSFCGASRFDSLHGLGGCKFCTGAGMATASVVDEKKIREYMQPHIIAVLELQKKWRLERENLQDKDRNRTPAIEPQG